MRPRCARSGHCPRSSLGAPVPSSVVTELWAALAIGVTVVTGQFAYLVHRIDRMEERVQRIDERFERMDSRLDTLSSEMHSRFDSVNARIDRLYELRSA